MNNLKGFTYWKSYHECLIELDIEDKKEILNAIDEFMFEDIEPNFTGTKRAIWLLIKPNLNQSKIKSKSKQNQNEVGDLYINNTNNIFIKPSIEEIRKYIKEERITNVDADQFYNFYESKGWMVGKNKMKDWKACIRTWIKRNSGQAVQETKLPDWVGKDFSNQRMTPEEEKEFRKELNLEEFE